MAHRRPDIGYIPSTQDIVEVMLALADVRPEDVIYDLGCGDGRIVITAAQRYRTRGVGIDIDPDRIEQATAAAQQAGVSDRVTFLQQDLFTTDFHEATVVSLYLLPHLNLKLRPALLRQLKPGARVISHDFDMGDWQPDRVIQMKTAEEEPVLYYWAIPAVLPTHLQE